jgi:HPr kinase/phosphorylase
MKIKELFNYNNILNLELFAGYKGLEKSLKEHKIQKKGLAFAGLIESVDDGRILIVGNSESKFFERFTDVQLNNIVLNLFEKKIPAIIFTNNNKIPEPFIVQCNRYNTPLFKTDLPTSEFINKITKILEDHLTPLITYHGVLVDVFGVGILIEGESGIGKSEIALDLILKGHRLVADDIINIKFIPPNLIIGSSPEPLKSHLEIRGLGIINVEEMFGIAVLRETKRIDLMINIVESHDKLDRLIFEEDFKEILSVKIPLIKLPVSTGRTLSTLVEVAARLFMLKKFNKKNSTERFLEKLYNGK